MTSATNPVGQAVGGLQGLIGWSLFGNLTFLVSQLLFLAALIFTEGAETLGTYGYATAITAPLFGFAQMGLRLGWSTDQEGLFSPASYLTLNGSNAAIAFIASIFIAGIIAPDDRILAATIVIAATRIPDSFSDLCYGKLQQTEQQKAIALSMIARSICGTGTAIIVLLLGFGLLWSMIGLLVAWLILLILCEGRWALKMHWGNLGKAAPWALLKTSLPMGWGRLLDLLSLSVPRFVVEQFFGLIALGHFTIFVHIYRAGRYIAQSIAIVFVVRAHTLHARGQAKAVYLLVFSATATIILIGIFAGIFIYTIGPSIKSLIWAEGPDSLIPVAAALIVALGFAFGATIIQMALTGLRKFSAFALLQLGILISTIIASIVGAQTGSIDGVVYGMAATSAVHVVLAAILFVVVERKQQIPQVTA